MSDPRPPRTDGGSDRIGELLADVADDLVGPARLANPRGGEVNRHNVVAGADGATHSRYPIAVAAAVVVLAVAAVGAWMAVGGDPAEPAVPGATSIPGELDPTGQTSTTTTTIVADPAAVAELTAAIDATMSVSWVAEVESDGSAPEGKWQVTYRPASPPEGRPYATARVVETVDPDGTEYEMFIDERGSLLPCRPDPSVREEILRRDELPEILASRDDLGCQPPAWARIDPDSHLGFTRVHPQFSVEQVRELWFARYIPLLKVDPSVATLDGGRGLFIAAHDPVHAFFGDAMELGNRCFEHGCGQFSLRLEDGLVTSLALRRRDPDGIQGSLDGEDLVATMELGDFGTAPTVDFPPAQDIVEVSNP